eukprot:11181782-Lingulodinium_polyedra.AAC.1
MAKPKQYMDGGLDLSREGLENGAGAVAIGPNVELHVKGRGCIRQFTRLDNGGQVLVLSLLQCVVNCGNVELALE